MTTYCIFLPYWHLAEIIGFGSCTVFSVDKVDENYKFSRKFLKAVALLTVFALFFLKIFINSIENNYKALSKLKRLE